MTLIEAMQISRQILDGKELPSVADRNAAIALGFEAMKRVKHIRETYQKASYVMLPGETQE